MDIEKRLLRAFTSEYNADPLIVKSPGRVNLIGEHTDYNNGLVLPAAIDKYIYLALSKNDSGQVRIYSLDQNDRYTGSIQSFTRSEKLWPDYLLGVIEQLQLNNYRFGGVDIAFTGDIPQGAGLSSSAALECATAFGISKLFNLGVESLDIALMAQAAENQFVGVNCGLMDQFASVFGKEQHLIKLDCSDYSYEYVPFREKGIKILLLDTRVKHSLASSAYNERRQQCEEGVALVRKHVPEVSSLRDISEEQLKKFVLIRDELLYKRCHYVVSEIARVEAAAVDLKNGDLGAFGKKMYETHKGLQYDYEVSCPELDLLTASAQKVPSVFGARMMGGGFGGCTINILPEERVEQAIELISGDYEKVFGLAPHAYVAQITSGTSIVPMAFQD